MKLAIEQGDDKVYLHEVRSQLQSVLDHLPVRVFWKDRDSVYLGCNQIFAEDAGLTSPSTSSAKPISTSPGAMPRPTTTGPTIAP